MDREAQAPEEFPFELTPDEIASLRSRDSEENKATIPPPEECIELHTVWVAECYTLVHLPGLIENLRRLGWLEIDGLGVEQIDAWIKRQQVTPYRTSSLQLGMIVRAEDKGRWIGARERLADIPAMFERGVAHISYLFPGLFIVMVQFVLREEHVIQLDSVLRQDLVTRIERHGDGLAFFRPRAEKRRRISDFRKSVRESAAEWLRTNLPGVFAHSQGIGCYPSCEFMTLEQADPFGIVEDVPEYVYLLGFGHVLGGWQWKGLPGIHLQLPHEGGATEHALTLVANKRSAFEGQDLTRFGGPTSRGFANRLWRSCDGMMRQWTLLTLVRAYEDAIGEIQNDLSVALGSESLLAAASQIETIEASLITLSGDGIAVLHELREAATDEHRFLFNVGAWRLRQWDTGSKSPGVVSQRPDGRGFVDWMIRVTSGLRQRIPAKANSAAIRAQPEDDDDLFSLMRSEIIQRVNRILRSEEFLRQVATAGAATVNARAQQRLAESNVRLQRWVLIFTAVLFVLGLIQVGAALLTIFTNSP